MNLGEVTWIDETLDTKKLGHPLGAQPLEVEDLPQLDHKHPLNFKLCLGSSLGALSQKNPLEKK